MESTSSAAGRGALGLKKPGRSRPGSNSLGVVGGRGALPNDRSPRRPGLAYLLARWVRWAGYLTVFARGRLETPPCTGHCSPRPASQSTPGRVLKRSVVTQFTPARPVSPDVKAVYLARCSAGLIPLTVASAIISSVGGCLARLPSPVRWQDLQVRAPSPVGSSPGSVSVLKHIPRTECNRKSV
jgi:hypothetical protein